MVHQSLVELGQLVHCLITHECLPHKQDKIRGVHSNQLGEEEGGGESMVSGGRKEKGERSREGEEVASHAELHILGLVTCTMNNELS